MNTMSRMLAGLIMTAAVLPAFAQETEMRPYASVMYDTVFSDKDRASDNATGVSVGVGKALNKYWGLEIGGFYDKADKKTGGNSWREYGGKIDGMFFYSRNPRFSALAAWRTIARPPATRHSMLLLMQAWVSSSISRLQVMTLASVLTLVTVG